jgi:hypothetical protein
MKMHTLRWRFTLLWVMCCCLGCRPHLESADSGGAVTLVDAGGPKVLELRIEVSQQDGGLVRSLLDPSSAPMLPVTQALNFAANLQLRNYRLRIFDEIDRALASDDFADVTPSGLRYHVGLVTPLRPGHRYTVVLDAQNGATFDGEGTEMTEQRFEFRTEGDREKEVPPKRSLSKHHHRGI